MTTTYLYEYLPTYIMTTALCVYTTTTENARKGLLCNVDYNISTPPNKLKRNNIGT